MARRKQTYLEEAYEYWREVWRRQMAVATRRSLFLRGSTLAALGGASALNSLLAACASGAETVQREVQREAERGTYQYSRYPLVEKYNWRLLPWGGTPYYGGHALEPNNDPPSNWDFFNSLMHSHTGRSHQRLMRNKYGPGAHMERLDTDKDFEGDLALEARPARDFSYWDFPIRPGTRFHDIPPVNGRELTADDVKYSFDRYLTSLHRGELVAYLDRVEVLDRYTARFHMKRPIFWWPNIVANPAFAIVAPEHAEGDRDHWRNQPIGTGPYVVTYSRFRDKQERVRHPHYNRPDERWPGVQLPFLDRGTGIYFADATARKTAFRTGQADYIRTNDKAQMDDVIATNPQTRWLVRPVSPDDREAFMFQWRGTTPFHDVRVRRAMSLALDRQRIIDTLKLGAAVWAHPIAYYNLGYEEPLHGKELGPWVEYNPTLARQLLREAGYEQGLEVELMVSGSVSDLHQVMQNMFADVGIRLVFDERESTEFTERRTQGNFKGLVRIPVVAAMAGPIWALNYYAKDSPHNVGGYSDPQMEAMIERALYTLDADEQVRILRQINDFAMDQVLTLEVFATHYIVGFAPWMHNAADHAQMSFNFWGSWQWAIIWLDDTAPGGRGGRPLQL